MKAHLYILILIGLALAVFGCRGRNQEPAQAPVQATQPAAPVSSGVPNIVINWPANGARVRIGQAFTVHTTATDASGVARIGYTIDNQAATPVEGTGQTISSASFPVTLKNKGVHTITVVAVNVAGTKSAPAVIRVVAVNALSDAPAADEPPTPRPQPPSSSKPLPTSPPAPAAPDQPAPPPAPANTSVSFAADPSSVPAGECTTVRWDAEGVREIYFEGAGVTGHEERRMCDLNANTTYVLHVIFQDGSARDYNANVTVTGSAPGPAGGQGQQGDAPAAPANCRASQITAHGALVQWEYDGNPGGFNLYVTRTQRVASAGGQARATTVENLNAGTRYRIDVRAFNAFGESPVNGCSVEVTTAQQDNGVFRVTNVTASVDPATFNGPCPKEFKFSGVITANRAGTVTYHWTDQDGHRFDRSTDVQAGDNTVSGITNNAIENGTQSAWIVIDSPNPMTSNHAEFNLTCTQGGGEVQHAPPAPTGCRAQPSGVGKIQLMWDYESFIPVNRAPSGFRVYQGDSVETSVATNVKTVIIPNLQRGVQYHFDVRAYNSVGESAANACAVDITVP